MIKSFLKKHFKHLAYFYAHLRYRMIVGLILSIVVGLLDGFGLAMFLPLLEMVDGSGTATSDNMGNLSFVADFLKYFGLELTLNVVLLFILFLFILKGIAKYVEGHYNLYIQQEFIVLIIKKCVDSMSNYKYNAFVQADSGKIQNTMSAEVGRVLNAYRGYFGTIQYAIFVLVYVFLAFLSNPQFAILVAIGGALTSLLFRGIYKKTEKISSSITLQGHIFQGLLIQSVAFFKYLRSTGRMSGYADKLKNILSKIEKDNKTMGLIQVFLVAVREPIVLTVVVAVIYLQHNYFGQELGMIILSLLFFYRALNYLMVMQTQWNGYLSMSGSVKNMDEFLANLKENKEKYGNKKIDHFTSNMVLNGTSFYYKSNDLILKSINLTIEKNKTVAFIGESGSGKTTLVNILTGLLPISEGRYSIDGIDSKDIDMRTFQNRIGYITQEPVIFDDNVYNNVTFWDEKTPENLNKFWEALRKASILEFVESLPEKENAPLGNNGIMVSGGQKQRLSIARELYKDIDILIMDEATSALDSETERAIQENIDALKGQYTIIIIAHRLSTIKNADEIVLMSKGEIIDKGSFTELIGSNETFKRMVNLQEL
jgi:ABC-type multidrug transport system fused ATPase/permease subunit